MSTARQQQPGDELPLARLRAARTRPDRDMTLQDVMAAQSQALRKLHRAVGGISEAWRETVPPEMLDKTALAGVSRGVLTVRVADAATKFRLDRFLRSGGEAELLRRASVSIRRIKLTL